MSIDLSTLEPVADAPVSPAIAIGSIALKLAVEYHGATVISDGSLYQQYRIEGKEMTPLTLALVLETAREFERHLLTTNERIAAIVVEALEASTEEEKG